MLLDLSLSLLGLHYQMRHPVSLRLRSSSRLGTTGSLLSSFSVSRLSSRLSSSRFRSRHSSSHVLVLERSLILLSGRIFFVVVPGARPVTIALVVRASTEVLVLQVRVLLAHLVLHAQMMTEKAETDMMMMMSDLSD